MTTGLVVSAEVYPALASRFDFWPVKTAGGQNAVIGACAKIPAAPEPVVRRLLPIERVDTTASCLEAGGAEIARGALEWSVRDAQVFFQHVS